MDKNNRAGFTLIEILVVATIIGLLAVTGVVSYTQLNINARNARRKADVENIRAALEMYRSYNDVYPSAAEGGLQALVSTYLKSVPTDPKSSTFNDYNAKYAPTTGSGAACDNSTNPCAKYSITVYLESVGAGSSMVADPYGFQ